MLQPVGINSLANNPLFSASEIGQSFQGSPLGFIDIGARGGAHEFVEPIAKLTAVLAFEPDEAECERLMQKVEVYEPWAAFKMEPIALSNTKSDAVLVLLSAPTNHSLLAPNTGFTQRYNMHKWQEVGREALQTETLDQILYSNRAESYRWGELIKLDTQGTEYEILQGATRTLEERTVAIVTEVAFCELYLGQKLFSEIELLLREHGFSFYGFTKIHHRSCKQLDKTNHITTERAFYADAVFFKDPLPGARNKKTLDHRGICALISSALLLGYYEFALELAETTWMHKPKELNNFKELIAQLSRQIPEATCQAVAELASQVNKDPALANVTVGNFIDRRRMICNYDDMLNINPLPKTL